MTRSKLESWSSTLRACVVACLIAMCCVGCAGFDDTFGEDMTPSDQDLSLQTWESNSCFSTILFRSDSIRSSNIGYSIMGVEKKFNFGERRTGFFSQFIPKSELNEDDDDDWTSEYPFGYEPIFDSLLFYFSLYEYSGDTTLTQSFEVYEALNVDFLKETQDSVFFDNFDVEKLFLTDEPIFTFTFPDQDREVYVSTSSYVRLYPTGTEASQDFIDRLLLKDDEANNNIYDYDYRSLFLKKFNGIYIKPVTTIATEPTSTLDSLGATYSFNTEGSGIAFFARSLYEEDPLIVKDTVAMSYGFQYYPSSDDVDDYYGFSINTVERSGMTYQTDLETSNILVEGMGGVVTKITFTPEMFAHIEEVLATTPDNNGEIGYNSIFVNQARLNIYPPEEFIPDMERGSYDSASIDPITIVSWYDNVPSRLGMYVDYTDYYEDYDDYEDDISTLTGISDYYYQYELYYDTTLPYNGYINRGLGCYDMIISAQLQDAWTGYLEAKEEAGGNVDDIDWDEVEDCSFVLAPEVSNLYSVKYATLQGMDDGANNAPMRLRLTYTLVK